MMLVCITSHENVPIFVFSPCFQISIGLQVEEARKRKERGEDGSDKLFKEAQNNLRDTYAQLREKQIALRKLRKSFSQTFSSIQY